MKLALCTDVLAGLASLKDGEKHAVSLPECPALYR